MHRRLAVICAGAAARLPQPPARVAGTAPLSAAKILENMEIGHNVLHGQWDWMNDPRIHSSTWDWDTASTAEAWKHSHNYVHHTFTNIRGKDKDLGYEIMRIDPEQKWHPVYLLQPFYNLLLVAFFEWGVALHDLDFEAIRKGEKSKAQVKRRAQGHRRQGEKPDRQGLHRLAAAERPGDRRRSSWRWRRVGSAAAAASPGARRRRGGAGRRPAARRSAKRRARPTARRAKANATANVVRNVWAYAIIFCGHFPDQTYTFSQEEVEDESRGGWYVRQLSGAANIEGGPLFHVASGNLGYQVEHHLFPDMPSTRYAEIAPQVKDDLRALRPPLQQRPVHAAAGNGAADDPAPRPPGRQAAAEAGPYRGEMHASV